MLQVSPCTKIWSGVKFSKTSATIGAIRIAPVTLGPVSRMLLYNYVTIYVIRSKQEERTDSTNINQEVSIKSREKECGNTGCKNKIKGWRRQWKD